MKFHVRELDKLLDALKRRGYDVIGPTVRDGAIVYDHLSQTEDLPKGITDQQEPGRYRLAHRDDGALFGFAVGPHSWKQYTHPAKVKLFNATQQNNVFRILNTPDHSKQYAFLGVRACELAAIRIQDRVILEGPYRDPVYQARRANAFLIAVQCTHSASTCFCASMGTGPHIDDPAVDMTLTELIDESGHWFLARTGSARGREVLAELECAEPTNEDQLAALSRVDAAARAQTRAIDNSGIRELLYQNFEHPRWDNVAERCLACANCTMVCPTCFCTTVEDVSDVTGAHAERWRLWDSCFTMNFSYIHGGSVRASGKSRYRQWMTHKLAAWIDQFGTSGCVGCGRCIAWCPAGIDITEELKAIRQPGRRARLEEDTQEEETTYGKTYA